MEDIGLKTEQTEQTKLTMDKMESEQTIEELKTAGLLRALFFGEKCATCVQFMECAGVRSICCVSIKYKFLFDKSRQISINIM